MNKPPASSRYHDSNRGKSGGGGGWKGGNKGGGKGDGGGGKGDGKGDGKKGGGGGGNRFSGPGGPGGGGGGADSNRSRGGGDSNRSGRGGWRSQGGSRFPNTKRTSSWTGGGDASNRSGASGSNAGGSQNVTPTNAPPPPPSMMMGRSNSGNSAPAAAPPSAMLGGARPGGSPRAGPSGGNVGGNVNERGPNPDSPYKAFGSADSPRGANSLFSTGGNPGFQAPPPGMFGSSKGGKGGGKDGAKGSKGDGKGKGDGKDPDSSFEASYGGTSMNKKQRKREKERARKGRREEEKRLGKGRGDLSPAKGGKGGGKDGKGGRDDSWGGKKGNEGNNADNWGRDRDRRGRDRDRSGRGRDRDRRGRAGSGDWNATGEWGSDWNKKGGGGNWEGGKWGGQGGQGSWGDQWPQEMSLREALKAKRAKLVTRNNATDYVEGEANIKARSSSGSPKNAPERKSSGFDDPFASSSPEASEADEPDAKRRKLEGDDEEDAASASPNFDLLASTPIAFQTLWFRDIQKNPPPKFFRSGTTFDFDATDSAKPPVDYSDDNSSSSDKDKNTSTFQSNYFDNIEDEVDWKLESLFVQTRDLMRRENNREALMNIDRLHKDEKVLFEILEAEMEGDKDDEPNDSSDDSAPKDSSDDADSSEMQVEKKIEEKPKRKRARSVATVFNDMELGVLDVNGKFVEANEFDKYIVDSRGDVVLKKEHQPSLFSPRNKPASPPGSTSGSPARGGSQNRASSSSPRNSQNRGDGSRPSQNRESTNRDSANRSGSGSRRESVSRPRSGSRRESGRNGDENEDDDGAERNDGNRRSQSHSRHSSKSRQMKEGNHSESSGSFPMGKNDMSWSNDWDNADWQQQDSTWHDLANNKKNNGGKTTAFVTDLFSTGSNNKAGNNANQDRGSAPWANSNDTRERVPFIGGFPGSLKNVIEAVKISSERENGTGNNGNNTPSDEKEDNDMEVEDVDENESNQNDFQNQKNQTPEIPSINWHGLKQKIKWANTDLLPNEMEWQSEIDRLSNSLKSLENAAKWSQTHVDKGKRDNIRTQVSQLEKAREILLQRQKAMTTGHERKRAHDTRGNKIENVVTQGEVWPKEIDYLNRGNVGKSSGNPSGNSSDKPEENVSYLYKLLGRDRTVNFQKYRNGFFQVLSDDGMDNINPASSVVGARTPAGEAIDEASFGGKKNIRTQKNLMMTRQWNAVDEFKDNFLFTSKPFGFTCDNLGKEQIEGFKGESPQSAGSYMKDLRKWKDNKLKQLQVLPRLPSPSGSLPMVLASEYQIHPFLRKFGTPDLNSSGGGNLNSTVQSAHGFGGLLDKLDPASSGVVPVALNERVFQDLAAKQENFEYRYHALLHGYIPPENSRRVVSYPLQCTVNPKNGFSDSVEYSICQKCYAREDQRNQFGPGCDAKGVKGWESDLSRKHHNSKNARCIGSVRMCVDVKQHFEFTEHHQSPLTLVEVKPAKDYDGIFGRAAERGWQTVAGPKAVVKSIGASSGGSGANAASSSSSASSAANTTNNSTSTATTNSTLTSNQSNCSQGDLVSKNASWWNPARSVHHKIQRMLMLYSEENKKGIEGDEEYESWSYGLVGQRVDGAWQEDSVLSSRPLLHASFAGVEASIAGRLPESEYRAGSNTNATPNTTTSDSSNSTRSYGTTSAINALTAAPFSSGSSLFLLTASNAGTLGGGMTGGTEKPWGSIIGDEQRTTTTLETEATKIGGSSPKKSSSNNQTGNQRLAPHFFGATFPWPEDFARPFADARQRHLLPHPERNEKLYAERAGMKGNEAVNFCQDFCVDAALEEVLLNAQEACAKRPAGSEAMNNANRNAGDSPARRHPAAAPADLELGVMLTNLLGVGIDCSRVAGAAGSSGDQGASTSAKPTLNEYYGTSASSKGNPDSEPTFADYFFSTTRPTDDSASETPLLTTTEISDLIFWFRERLPGVGLHRSTGSTKNLVPGWLSDKDKGHRQMRPQEVDAITGALRTTAQDSGPGANRYNKLNPEEQRTAALAEKSLILDDPLLGNDDQVLTSFGSIPQNRLEAALNSNEAVASAYTGVGGKEQAQKVGSGGFSRRGESYRRLNRDGFSVPPGKSTALLQHAGDHSRMLELTLELYLEHRKTLFWHLRQHPSAKVKSVADGIVRIARGLVQENNNEKDGPRLSIAGTIASLFPIGERDDGHGASSAGGDSNVTGNNPFGESNNNDSNNDGDHKSTEQTFFENRQSFHAMRQNVAEQLQSRVLKDDKISKNGLTEFREAFRRGSLMLLHSCLDAVLPEYDVRDCRFDPALLDCPFWYLRQGSGRSASGDVSERPDVFDKETDSFYYSFADPFIVFQGIDPKTGRKTTEKEKAESIAVTHLDLDKLPDDHFTNFAENFRELTKVESLPKTNPRTSLMGNTEFEAKKTLLQRRTAKQFTHPAESLRDNLPFGWTRKASTKNPSQQYWYNDRDKKAHNQKDLTYQELPHKTLQKCLALMVELRVRATGGAQVNARGEAWDGKVGLEDIGGGRRLRGNPLGKRLGTSLASSGVSKSLNNSSGVSTTGNTGNFFGSTAGNTTGQSSHHSKSSHHSQSNNPSGAESSLHSSRAGSKDSANKKRAVTVETMPEGYEPSADPDFLAPGWRRFVARGKNNLRAEGRVYFEKKMGMDSNGKKIPSRVQWDEFKWPEN